MVAVQDQRDAQGVSVDTNSPNELLQAQPLALPHWAHCSPKSRLTECRSGHDGTISRCLPILPEVLGFCRRDYFDCNNTPTTLLLALSP